MNIINKIVKIKSEYIKVLVTYPIYSSYQKWNGSESYEKISFVPNFLAEDITDNKLFMEMANEKDFEKIKTIKKIISNHQAGQLSLFEDNAVEKYLNNFSICEDFFEGSINVRVVWKNVKCKVDVCGQCGKLYAIKDEVKTRLYEHSYAEKPEVKKLCSEECRDNAEESYYYCEGCDRFIYYEDNFHNHNDATLCDKCYSKELLTNGLTVIEDTINGMFFSKNELYKNKWEFEVSKFVNYANKDDTLNRAKELLETKRVLFRYTSLSIVGNEGYVEIWTKNKTKEN